MRDNIKHDLAIDAPLSNAILDLAPAHIITTNYDKLIEGCKSIQRDNYDVIMGGFENVGEYKEFLKDNFDLVDSNDIFDFTFDGWLDISEEKSQKILADTIDIYKEQKDSAVRSYTDPLRSQIELICILYITETIHSIECLREIMDASEFLQFFLAPNDFDYRQVDFSDYMWENIAQCERFMEFFLAHKSDVIPNLKKKIDTDEATEFERKILYGFLLDKNEIL